MNKHLIMYWRLQDLWGPANIVASCVTELDDTLFDSLTVSRTMATRGAFVAHVCHVVRVLPLQGYY
jgi:hypothetical protein